MQVQIDIISEKDLKPPVWSTTMLYSAIDWWKRNGSFNKDLYEKFIEIKYQIEIK
jgi:hypothetical protein